MSRLVCYAALWRGPVPRFPSSFAGLSVGFPAVDWAFGISVGLDGAVSIL